MTEEIDQDRVAALMEMTGRCLVQYQRIERALKILLPHLDKPGAEPSDAVRNWREFLDAKHTLGPLMERLKGFIKSPDIESAYAHLEQIVNDRNDLVHHFFTSPRLVLRSAEAIESGILELRKRLDHSRPFEEMLVSLVDEFAKELELSRSAAVKDER